MAEHGSAARAPVHLWIVGVLALLWNLMGAFDYVATQFRLEFYMGQFSPQQLQYFYGFPAWATAGWATAVWLGLAGTVVLLLRRRAAVWLYAVSLAGMAVSSLYTLVLTDGLSVMGPGSGFFTALIWVIALGLLAYAWWLARRGVLR